MGCRILDQAETAVARYADRFAVDPPRAAGMGRSTPIDGVRNDVKSTGMCTFVFALACFVFGMVVQTGLLRDGIIYLRL